MILLILNLFLLALNSVLLLFNAVLVVGVLLHHLVVVLLFFSLELCAAGELISLNLSIVQELEVGQRSENIVNLRFLVEVDVDGHELWHGREDDDVVLQILTHVAVEVDLLDFGKDTHVLRKAHKLVLGEGELKW